MFPIEGLMMATRCQLHRYEQQKITVKTKKCCYFYVVHPFGWMDGIQFLIQASIIYEDVQYIIILSCNYVRSISNKPEAWFLGCLWKLGTYIWEKVGTCTSFT